MLLQKEGFCMSGIDTEESIVYEVVVNQEEQYSIWPAYRGEAPPGWKSVGRSGLKQECLDYIQELWIDMRPLSLRKKMEESEARRPELEAGYARKLQELESQPKDPRDNLIQFLSSGMHPVEIGLRPEKNLRLFKAAIDRGYVHVKFMDTRGGTELGVRLDTATCDFEGADFENGTGKVRLTGDLTLNFQPVLCEAVVDLETLAGEGKLNLGKV